MPAWERVGLRSGLPPIRSGRWILPVKVSAAKSGTVSPVWRVLRRFLWNAPVIPATWVPACRACQTLSRAAGSASVRYQSGVPAGRCKRIAVMPS